jgi:hypothetical protein
MASKNWLPKCSRGFRSDAADRAETQRHAEPFRRRQPLSRRKEAYLAALQNALKD